MIINNDRILKNGDTIFKSQVVDSYLKTNTSGSIITYITTTGLTTTNSLSAYYQTPTAVIKKTDTDDPSANFNFGDTGESSEKKLYFCGNLDAVRSLRPYQYIVNGCFGGDLVCLINEFPQIECFCGSNRLSRYDSGTISNASFPRSLEKIELCDCWVSGDIGTTSGLENVRCWDLQYVKFSGNFHDIKTTSIEDTHFRYTPTNLKIDLNCLTANNPNYSKSCLYYACGAELDASTINVSNLQNICWYLRYTNAGQIGNWVFNTGLTSLCVTACIGGDMTNFDFSDTNLDGFSMCDVSYGNCNLGGSLSGWTLPDTLRLFNVGYATQLTSVPSDYSNTNLNNLSIQRAPLLSGDVTTWIFPSAQTSFYLNIYDTALCGNLENLDVFSGTNFQLRESCFTGDITNIDFGQSSSIYFDGNCLTGNIADITVPDTTTGYINFGNNPDVYMDLTSSSLNTCNSFGLFVCNNDYIRGDLSNLTLGSNMRYVCFDRTCVCSDLNNLNFNNALSFTAYSACLEQDITGLFTGTTNLTNVCFYNNPNLSGDTTNWLVDDMCRLNLGITCLSGRLCQACPYQLAFPSTTISSCIEEDFDLSNRLYDFDVYNSCIQGHLSGVTLYYTGLYRFSVYSNPNLYGSNEFVDNIFVNRKNFGRSYIYFGFQNIGDTVSGTSEILGDLGTYGGDENDLTEAEVNNLVAGTDYDGNGTNTPWNGKNKIYWMKNALVSSSSTSKRYSTFTINYS